jgi:hypothetical protein
MGIVESRLDKAEEDADKLLEQAYAEGVKPLDLEGAPEGEGEAEAGGSAAPAEELDAEGKPKVKEPDKPNAEEETYKHRFEIMEGKYKAEVPRLNEELRQSKDVIASLQGRLTALEEAAKAAPKVEAPPEEDYEVDAFVADNPGAAKLLKRLEDKHKAETEALRNEIKSVGTKAEAKVSEFRQETAMDRFEKSMADSGVPEWRTIDSDPAFMAWLNKSPYNVRVLQSAASEFDAKTVSAFFLDYKRSLAPPDNGGKPPDNGGGQNKIDKFTAPPSSGGGGTPPKSDTQPALTKANYEKFMHQSTMGKYKPSLWGGLTEAQMEAKFDDAIAKNALL